MTKRLGYILLALLILAACPVPGPAEARQGGEADTEEVRRLTITMSIYSSDTSATIRHLNECMKKHGCIATNQSNYGGTIGSMIMLVFPADQAEAFVAEIGRYENVSNVSRTYSEVSPGRATMGDLYVQGMDSVNFLTANTSPNTTTVTIMLHNTKAETAYTNRMVSTRNEKSGNGVLSLIIRIAIMSAVAGLVAWIRQKRK